MDAAGHLMESALSARRPCTKWGRAVQEIQEYVAKATNGASARDPFEGMSPEEINAYMEQQQLAGGR